MEPILERIEISPSIGEVSSITLIPEGSKHLMILGHGAGANMNHRFMEGLARALAEASIATVRFNFPFMEEKKGRPDLPAVTHVTILGVLKHVHLAYPGLTKILAGKSFGGRMSSQMVAKFQPEEIKALVFFGFPLHAPAKPGIDRAEHLFQIRVPMLFLQGENDALAKLDLLQPLLEKLPLAKLKIYPRADHSFKCPKKANISEGEMWRLLAIDTQQFIFEL